MPQSIPLSLILCTYGRTSELAQLFRSLAAQTFRDFEVIVVDQNADMRIKPILRHAAAMGIKFRHVRQEVPNLSAARNVGLHHAQGEWVGFPDDDCWYEPDMIEQLSGVFKGNGTLSGVVARWAECSEPAELPWRFTWTACRAFRGRAAVSFMLFFRRDLFEHIGGFDPRLGVGQWFGAGEETDFMMRALRWGAHIRFQPSAVVHHPPKKPENSKESLLDNRHRERGPGALYAKHRLPLTVIARGLVAPLFMPLLGMGGSLSIGWMTVLGRLEGMVQWHLQARKKKEFAPFTTARMESSKTRGAPFLMK